MHWLKDKPDQKEVASDFAKVGKESQWWQSHEQSNTAAAPVVQDLKTQTDSMQQTLGLLQQGKISESQADTMLRQS